MAAIIKAVLYRVFMISSPQAWKYNREQNEAGVPCLNLSLYSQNLTRAQPDELPESTQGFDLPRAGARANGHPVIASAEPEERWLYCYPDDAFAEY